MRKDRGSLRSKAFWMLMKSDENLSLWWLTFHKLPVLGGYEKNCNPEG